MIYIIQDLSEITEKTFVKILHPIKGAERDLPSPSGQSGRSGDQIMKSDFRLGNSV